MEQQRTEKREMNRTDIRLIALDLDGTLLNSMKLLSPANAAALERAARAGVLIVPTTGRFYGGIPEFVRRLPFLRYAIAVNGAQVYDIRGDRTIAAAEIPLERTLELMETLDEYPVAYDCFVQGKGWMERRLWEHAADYTDDWYCLQVLHDLRTPVDDLKAFLRKLGGDAQKVQFFTKDAELRLNLLKELPRRWPDIAVTTSVPTNVELNILRANKGGALKQLTDYLGLSMEQVMAVGDGMNDLTMLRMAGVGVAMGNACPEAMAAADAVTADCDHDGVAQAIARFCFGEE